VDWASARCAAASSGSPGGAAHRDEALAGQVHQPRKSELADQRAGEPDQQLLPGVVDHGALDGVEPEQQQFLGQQHASSIGDRPGDRQDVWLR